MFHITKSALGLVQLTAKQHGIPVRNRSRTPKLSLMSTPHSVWDFYLSRTGMWTHLELDRRDSETVLPGLAFLNRRGLLFVTARGCLKEVTW